MKTRIFLLLISLFTMADVVHGTAALQSGVIKGENADLRAEPGPYGYILTVLKPGLPVAVVEQSGRWYKVQLPDGRMGWVYRQFIEVKPLIPVTSSRQYATLPVDKLIASAKSFLEITYVYGGDSPQGFDCSGFTMYVFSKFGISLPHQANLQMKAGREVSAMEALMPGDLVFFKTMGSTIVNHVGIYLGNKQFIHASSGYGAVRISSLNSGYYFDCYAGGRRYRNSNGRDEQDELERM
jgi:hypothetical protein